MERASLAVVCVLLVASACGRAGQTPVPTPSCEIVIVTSPDGRSGSVGCSPAQPLPAPEPTPRPEGKDEDRRKDDGNGKGRDGDKGKNGGKDD